MPSRLREPFGKAGLIVAVVALVASLAGGAYAADRATDSAKKRNHKAKKNKKKKAKGVTVAQVRKIAKQEAQKYANSNPGPAGPQGPAGANGNDGQNGSNGSQGPKGDTGDQGPQGIQGIQGIPGIPGKPWTAGGTLPPEETETGTWAGNFTEEGFAEVSFPIPLEAALAPANAIIVPEGGTPPADCENEGHAGTASKANPEAKPGFLCVYVTGFLSGGSVAAIIQPATLPPEEGANVSGAIVYMASAGPDVGYGTWAVTAPSAP